MTNIKNIRFSPFILGTCALGTMFIGALGDGIKEKQINDQDQTEMKNLTLSSKIEGLTSYDVNKDGLMDLVDKKGNTYLQTPEGIFVSYENIVAKEKAKYDSLFQAKKDSLREVFGNKLEKISQR